MVLLPNLEYCDSVILLYIEEGSGEEVGGWDERSKWRKKGRKEEEGKKKRKKEKKGKRLGRRE